MSGPAARSRPHLVTLGPQHEKAFFAYLEEYARTGEPTALPDVTPATYGMFLRMLRRHQRAAHMPPSFSPYRRFFLANADESALLGTCTFRFLPTYDVVNEGGHIGYGVAPSQRGQGYAKLMCRKMIRFGRIHGYRHILITCDLDNLASAHVIEACGGVLDDIRPIPGRAQPKKRYWVSER